jgi:deoxycytidine triphosphate deaminase
MILSGNDIEKFRLLKNADINNKQTQGWDLRLEKVYCVVNKPFGEKINELDYVRPYLVEKEQSKSIYCLSQIVDGGKIVEYFIPANTSALFKIMETVNLLPIHSLDGKENRFVNAFVLPKSSLSRRGVFVHSAWWDAGYVGSGVVLVKTSEIPLRIKPGDAFAQMIFLEGTPTEKIYDGHFQGEGLKKLD